MTRAREISIPSTPTALVLLNNTDFSAVASASIDDVFSATYDNYLLVMSFTSSANAAIRFRYRASSADNSTSNYSYHIQFSTTSSTAYAAVTGNAQTSNFLTSSEGVSSLKAVSMTVFRPFLTDYSAMLGMQNLSSASGAAPYSGGIMHSAFTATTSFTGFSVFPDSGTITGSVKVYGYKE